jgi:hypothetical protein
LASPPTPEGTPEGVGDSLGRTIKALADSATSKAQLDDEKVKEWGARRVLRWIVAGWALLVVTGQMVVLTIAF